MPSERTLLLTAALIFAMSAAATVLWCEEATALGPFALCGSGTMPMAWMRASFLIQWTVMMVAMMLPSLLPMLIRFRRAVAGAGEARLGRLTLVVGVGYFSIWTLLGLAALPMESALEAAGPLAGALVVVIAASLQLTRWKAHRLACRRAPTSSAGVEAAWRHGLTLGLDCARSCGNWMAILMALGMMEPPVMALVTATITLERLAPAGGRVARLTSLAALGLGLWLTARAAPGLIPS